MEQPDTSAAETAEETPVETTESTDAPPWGEDFDAARAWKTIQDQRAEAKELKQRAQRAAELEAELEDEQKLLARLQERGYELDEEDEDPDLFEDDELDPSELLTAQEQRLARLEAQEAERLYQADLAEALPDEVKIADLSEPDRLFIRQKCAEGGDNKAALVKAVKAWEELDRERLESYGKRYRESKKTSHVSKVGSQATDAPDWSSMSRSEQAKYMAEQVQQGRQQ